VKLTAGSLSPGLSCPPRDFSACIDFEHPTKDANPERPSVPSSAEGTSGAEGFLSFPPPSLTPFRMNTYRKQGEGGGYRIVSPFLLQPSAEPRSTNPLFSTTCALFAHSLAQSGKSSAFFSMVCALFAKTWGVYPNYSVPEGFFRGAKSDSFPLSSTASPKCLSVLGGLCASVANASSIFGLPPN